jgi:hypothetical protein
MKKKRKQEDLRHLSKQKVPMSSQVCLLLGLINHFITDSFDNYYSEFSNKSASSHHTSDVLKLFKFANCTYLTESVFVLLA